MILSGVFGVCVCDDLSVYACELTPFYGDLNVLRFLFLLETAQRSQQNKGNNVKTSIPSSSFTRM